MISELLRETLSAAITTIFGISLTFTVIAIIALFLNDDPSGPMSILTISVPALVLSNIPIYLSKRVRSWITWALPF